jgi:hypothetical protein
MERVPGTRVGHNLNGLDYEEYELPKSIPIQTKSRRYRSSFRKRYYPNQPIEPEPSREEIDTDARAKLDKIVFRERRTVIDRSSFVGFNIEEALRDFRQTSDYLLALSLYQRNLEIGEPNPKGKFFGAAFELFAYNFVAAQSPKDIVVLSPQNSFELSTVIYPSAEQTYLGNITTVLDGQSYCPDGMLVSRVNGTNMIVGSIEASLLTDDRILFESFRHKLSRFRLAKKKFSTLFLENAVMLHIKPTGTEFNTSSLGKEILPVVLPVSAFRFKEVMEGK